MLFLTITARNPFEGDICRERDGVSVSAVRHASIALSSKLNRTLLKLFIYSTIAGCEERTKEEWIYGKLERKKEERFYVFKNEKKM